MRKEEIKNILISPVPDIRIRVIEFGDADALIYNKIKFPFKLYNSITVCIMTTKRNFSFCIHNGFTWNGADIPRFLWRIIGARTDNQFLIGSMIHDYLLDFKHYMMNEILNNDVSVSEYRRLSSLIFREIIKYCGTNKIKANVMSFGVDFFQTILQIKNYILGKKNVRKSIK